MGPMIEQCAIGFMHALCFQHSYMVAHLSFRSIAEQLSLFLQEGLLPALRYWGTTKITNRMLFIYKMQIFHTLCAEKSDFSLSRWETLENTNFLLHTLRKNEQIFCLTSSFATEIIFHNLQ